MLAAFKWIVGSFRIIFYYQKYDYLIYKNTLHLFTL